MNLQCLLAEKYVATLPKIRTVIWVASLRSFNKERESARKERDFFQPALDMRMTAPIQSRWGLPRQAGVRCRCSS